ncbi:MAG TPA: PEP-CTERM sorting domain-containing protein, partial [Candidatus Limnocylindria bacterium]|nr:PEP-CTERM sorting domain-containing protein [Candidatus Limnocylindria bacterium]
PLVGQSTMGFFTIPSSGTISIFGTGPGQVGGFYLTSVIPEPSTFALALLGLALWSARRACKK